MAYTHTKFLKKVAKELERELQPKCECECAPPREVTSLTLVATINGEPFAWDLARHPDSDVDYSPFLDAITRVAKGLK